MNYIDKFFIFTIYQNYTLALNWILSNQLYFVGYNHYASARLVAFHEAP